MDSTLIIVLAILLLALIILNNIKILPSSESVSSGCAGTQYGCCSDGVTTKMNLYGTNCTGYIPPPPPTPYPPPPPPPPPPQPVGGCAGTQYGCCPNSTTPKFNTQGTNCPNYPKQLIGGCSGTQYGCCPDGVTPRNQNGTSCPNYPR